MIFPTAYAPNTTYLSAIAHSERFCIDVEEPYVRQTFRNRCEILTSQGVQKLSVPIEKKSTQSGAIKDVKIDYAENWQRQHWRSLQAAYNNSPYFLYYQDELRFFYEKYYSFLVEFNAELLTFILNKMKLEGRCQVENFAKRCHPEQSEGPVKKITDDRFFASFRMTPYQQVFTNQNFVPNLSSLDLLFNCGPESKSYLFNFLKTEN
jgi:hypothetical protein